MKKYLKYIALAGALSLCLLLTACYQPPDDVNHGVPTGTGNALPFQTLAPTATVTMTPDTVVIETQNGNPHAAAIMKKMGLTAA